ncbi:ATP phosphoribosyltransferase regulatory subunit [Microcoleus sp. FACHB-1515]|uniref:ATP phosphoribosyltransferase regulatory subunit n=1 Tax=Cyanophyceae TaxID=3028117 RepID=UPI00168691E3|nr:ATP phosphoribosyltransferase regulatory subunit [Microcoleus sp. FACHB-1515]MBD2090988.1 ATP phosphoribosyltransferase regulatory subunit [Microcoleus sp. FACHB-1515]
MYQPPAGARDLFPLEVAQKRWIEERLQQKFHRWGYHRIITSTLEHLDTLMAGGAVDRASVIQVQNDGSEPLGLRPELTASIARAAVTRMAGVPHPIRLYYNSNVFLRSTKGHDRQQEFFQAGVELLGAAGMAADAEVLLLLADGLRNLDLDSWHLVLGEAGLARSLLTSFPEPIRPIVRQAIAHLDRLAIENLSLSAELRDRALLLLDLRGRPADVLQQVSRLDLDTDQRQIVNRLKSIVELLADSGTIPNLTIDLSLMRTFDYYTGIVFEVVSSSGQRILGQGGRYDQLLSLYHPQGNTYPGVGFVLNIEELHQTLLPTGQLPSRTPAIDYLVVPKTAQAYARAFSHAQTLRESAVRVEVELGQRHPDEIRQYAHDRRIGQIVWVDEAGDSAIEAL